VGAPWGGGNLGKKVVGHQVLREDKGGLEMTWEGESGKGTFFLGWQSTERGKCPKGVVDSEKKDEQGTK